jgi:hypothetical protein
MLAGALILPVLVISPASAADHIICVGAPPGAACDQTVGSVSAAIVAANGNSVDDTIWLAAATYNDGPYVLDGVNHAITLKGSGEANTVLTLAASATGQTYVDASEASVQDLTITMAGATSSGDTGLHGFKATVDHVTIDATTTSGAVGFSIGQSNLSHVVVEALPDAATGPAAIYSAGGNTVVDASLTGSQGFSLSDPNTTDHLSRVRLRTDFRGVVTDSGTIDIDNSVVELGTSSGVALAAINFNNGTADKAVNADHVTVVGGDALSKGAWAYAAAPGAKQTSTITLTNSIIRGPGTSLQADATNNGAQGGSSTATVDVSYTDYQTSAVTIGANGAGGIPLPGTGNLVDVDPGFVGPTDLHLTVGSPVVDKGKPAAGSPADVDLDGLPRVVDGDAVPGAVRDLGAYELPDSLPPDTVIVSGPSGPGGDPTPTFTFSSESGATFECKVDAGAFAACTSPYTSPALSDGAHAFSVRAADAASNVDPSPATRSFTVDTTPPDTTLTKKPKKKSTRATAKFAFASSEAGSTFECSLDGKAFVACGPTYKVRVKVGKHTVLVRATDALGNADATPAKYKFKRVRKS